MKQKQIPSFSTLPISNSGGRIPNVLSGGYFIMEIWKDIKGYKNYQVSNKGRVRSLDRIVEYDNRFGSLTRMSLKGVIIKPGIRVGGYKNVSLRLNNQTRQFFVHRLVLQCFASNPKNKPQCNHIDGNPSNNNVENLEWCTGSENQIHRYHVLGKGQTADFNGEKNPNNKLTLLQVSSIISQYKNKIKSALEISVEYNIARNYVYQLAKGKTWKHVK